MIYLYIHTKLLSYLPNRIKITKYRDMYKFDSRYGCSPILFLMSIASCIISDHPSNVTIYKINFHIYSILIYFVDNALINYTLVITILYLEKSPTRYPNIIKSKAWFRCFPLRYISIYFSLFFTKKRKPILL